MKGIFSAVARMVEIRDPYTSGHEHRVGLIARAIGKELGWSTQRCKSIELIGLIHDVGKIAVPAEILSKPMRLNALEMGFIKRHAQVGYDMMKDIQFDSPVAETILQHHERSDGSGYPHGLKGDQIILEARVITVADVLDAIASDRPYRPALGVEAALEELTNGRGTLYDTDVVNALLRLFREKGFKCLIITEPLVGTPPPAQSLNQTNRSSHFQPRHIIRCFLC